MVIYMMVLSANSLMLLLIESGISLMYMRNRQGPSTDPCGTPDNTVQASDFSPSRTTFCDLSDKKDLIHAITVGGYQVNGASAEAFAGQLYQVP